MRILLLNQYFRPDASASARLLSELADDLASEHDVTVLVGRPSYEPGVGDIRASSTRLHVVRVPSTAFSRQRPGLRVLNYVSYLAAVVAASLFRRRPDVIIVGSDPPLLGFVGWLISRVRRAPLLHLLWDIQPQATIAAARFVPAAGLLDRANRIALVGAAGIAVPTRAMAATVDRLGVAPRRVTVIPHWEDIDAIRPGPKDNAFSRRHGLVDRFVVMYAGNFGLTQQLDRYLELCARLGGTDDSRLVFIGGGASMYALLARRRARNFGDVQILPYQPHALVPQMFASADVFVVPLAAGLTEFMLPSKVYTIMAAGRPLVAAIDPACDIADMIREVGCGFVAPPGDLDDLAARLVWLRAHPAARVEMGRRAREAAERRFSRTIAAERYKVWLRQFETSTAATNTGR